MKLRAWFILSLAALLSGCAAVQGVPLEAKTNLVPGGTLRVAINFGNPILATRTKDGPRGVSIDSRTIEPGDLFAPETRDALAI